MSVSEVLLMHAHGVDVVRSEGCACGGRIIADALDESTWPTAIRDHNRTDRHLRWRAWRDASPQGGCTPTAGPTRVDLSSRPPVRSVPALRRGQA